MVNQQLYKFYDILIYFIQLLIIVNIITRAIINSSSDNKLLALICIVLIIDVLILRHNNVGILLYIFTNIDILCKKIAITSVIKVNMYF